MDRMPIAAATRGETQAPGYTTGDRSRLARRFAFPVVIALKPLTSPDPRALMLDVRNRIAWRNGAMWQIAPTPFRLLVILAGNLGRRVTLRDIADRLWGDDPEGGPDWSHGAIGVHVHRLRPILRKLGLAIRANWSAGYELVEVAA
jgi:DNA-binding response OmpR family regulator